MIEFPNLWGLNFNIDRVAFNVFDVDIFWYGIIIAIAFMTAILLAMKDSRKLGFDSEMVVDLAIIVIPVAIIFARLFYVFSKWSEFKDNPIDIFNTRLGGLAIYGGVIGAIITVYLFAKFKKINVLRLCDFGAVYLVLGQAIGRWGNFVNQEAFGSNTDLPWGMTGDTIRYYLMELSLDQDMLDKLGVTIDPSRPVHPTFLYESLICLGIFFFLLWYRRRKKFEGEVFFMYMALYGTGRFFIEGLRLDSLMIGSLRISQVLAFIFVITSLTAIILKRKKSRDLAAEIEESGKSKYSSILQQLKAEESEGDDNAEKADTAGENSGASENDRSGSGDVSVDETIPTQNNKTNEEEEK